MQPPVVILVRPQLGENIGAVARAMANFGFRELRLVAPRDGWPNERAVEVASGGASIVKSAKVFETFAEAMADIHIAYATTARPRDMEKRVVTPDAAMKEMAGDKNVAFVFGPERTGLENDEIVLCDTLITIPTSPDYSSLNLAQSMVVIGYEWFKVSCELRVASHKKNSLATSNPQLATKQDWQGLFDQLDAYLEEAEYYRVDHKKTIMWQNMRNMFLRGEWNEQEIRTFRGMLRVLYEGRTAGAKTAKKSS